MTVRASAGAELQLLVLTWPEMVKAAENHPDVMSCIAKEAQSHLRARRLAATVPHFFSLTTSGWDSG